MQQITLSGTLLDDAEKCIDRNGREYVRFNVTCGSEGPGGRTEFTHYSCTCYLPGYDKLRRGDQVFVTGKLSARVRTDERGKTYLNLNVFVYQATQGRPQDKKR